jgi:hypothetical protein
VVSVAERKANVRLMLRLFGLIVIAGALAMGLGLPALLLAQEGSRVTDPEGLKRITNSILGGGIGLGVVLFGLSFLAKGRD